MTTWEKIREQAEFLYDYGFKHTYTDDESAKVNEIFDALCVLAVRVEADFKQVRRSAGGLTNKITAQVNIIKKLEDRLAELEAENAELRSKE